MWTQDSKNLSDIVSGSLSKDAGGYDPTAHPRWEPGTSGGRGGEFRPKREDGAAVAEPSKKPAGDHPAPMRSTQEMPSVHDSLPSMMQAMRDRGHITAMHELKTGSEGKGVAQSFFVTFKDGKRCVYKPDHGGLTEWARSIVDDETEFMDEDQKQEWMQDPDNHFSIDLDVKDSARELAVNEIDRAMGLGVVPDVIDADYGNGKGTAMAFVEGWNGHNEEVKGQIRQMAEAGHPDLFRVAALDLVTGNTDRHKGNYLIGNEPAKDAQFGGMPRIYAIDHNAAISDDSDWSQWMCSLFWTVAGKQIPKQVKAEIDKLDPDKLGEIMHRRGFKDADVDAAKSRLSVLQESDSMPSNYAHFMRSAANRAGHVLGANIRESEHHGMNIRPV